MHADLHETTDTDFTEFRPAKASRDGLQLDGEDIPDGFYLIGSNLEPQHEWHKAIIDSVREVTKIAQPDVNNQIVELDVVQDGVVNSNPVGKGKGAANALYATTTEVYPSSLVTDEECNNAQVAAIVGGLDYLIQKL